MYGKVKLTKRQIKEDKFTTFMLTAKHQFIENWQWFVIGIAAVILVIVAVIYYLNSQEASRQEANERLSRALLDFRAGSHEVTILSLADIIDDYPGTAVADQATFLLARLNYELRNYPEAQRYFEMYVETYEGNDLRRASSLGGIAACYENLGNYTEAARRFAVAVDEYPDGPLAGDYRLAAMRNFLIAGEIEPARTQMEAIRRNFAGTELERNAIKLFNEKSRI
ncbi:MAG: tetratricopeptide repeat protein [Candidatus Zixiibacteriota bacterium]|nr:MAG: tetratricopeptide repeat protein [candidate division Zixibacteria bacterium]